MLGRLWFLTRPLIVRLLDGEEWLTCRYYIWVFGELRKKSRCWLTTELPSFWWGARRIVVWNRRLYAYCVTVVSSTHMRLIGPITWFVISGKKEKFFRVQWRVLGERRQRSSGRWSTEFARLDWSSGEMSLDDWLPAVFWKLPALLSKGLSASLPIALKERDCEKDDPKFSSALCQEKEAKVLTDAFFEKENSSANRSLL